MNPISTSLLFQTLALSAGVALVALLRRPLARAFDARAVYLLWLCVPAALAVALLPSPWSWAAPPLPAVQQWLGEAPTVAAAGPGVAPAAASLPWANMATAAWLGGALLLGLVLGLQQQRFGHLLRRVPGASHWQLPAGCSACVVGVWRPRLALPADFETRFDAAERELILAHEAVHLRRLDNLWNLLAALCCCLQWFNPLAWWAWRRMRADQELACDAVVLIERLPGADLGRYAQALVRSHEQANRALLPTLASPWRPRSGLVERVQQLRAHAARRGRRRHDRGLVALLVLGLAGTVSAATALKAPDAAATSDAAGTTAIDDQAPSTLHWRLQSREGDGVRTAGSQSMLLRPGKSPGGASSRHVESNAAGPLWCFETVGTRFRDGSWRIAGRLLDAECRNFLAEPRDIATDGSAHAFQGRLADGTPVSVELSARRQGLPAGSVWLDVDIDHQAAQAASASNLVLLGPLGERLRVQARPPGGEPLAVDLVVTAQDDAAARIRTRLLLGEAERLLAEPQVVTRWDEPARLRWQDPAGGRSVALTLTPHRVKAAAGAQPGTR